MLYLLLNIFLELSFSLGLLGGFFSSCDISALGFRFASVYDFFGTYCGLGLGGSGTSSSKSSP